MTYDGIRIRQAWPYEVKVKHAEMEAIRRALAEPVQEDQL